MGETVKARYQKRLGALKSERSSWMPHWREINDNLLPRSGRFFVEDRNRGERAANPIYDSTGTRALRVLAAGMMAGMTSPARPWFRLATPDPDLMEHAPVRHWLHQVTERMRGIYERSNFYRSLHSMYEDLGAFGTGVALVMEDHQSVIRCYNSPVGEFMLAQNERGLADTLYREYQMTVGQMVGQFGLEKVSRTVRQLYEKGNYDEWVTVVHAVEPRPERDFGKRDARNMPVRSVYFEAGADGEELLRESGFADFPGLCPRWHVTGGDIYGSRCPGMEALGDINQLQHEQLRKAQAIDKMTDPPLQGPPGLEGKLIDGLPGGVTYVDGLTTGGGGMRPLYEVNLRLDYLLEDIRDVRDRINSTFYADLFQMLAMSDRRQMTATEVAERHEEKLLVLGPVLERLHGEMLSPAIDRTFSIMARNGLLPEPPPELSGLDLRVEYISMLAQAQRAVGTQAIDRLAGYVINLAQANPEVTDKFDFDQSVDEYADSLGVPPAIVRSDDAVELLRQQRAQQQAQQQQMAMAAPAAQSAKTLSDTGLEDRNALTALFSGM
jgi:hypothetical protein